MWLLFALISFFAWGAADLFYKKGSAENEKYSHLKVSIVVGVVMGATAIVTLLTKDLTTTSGTCSSTCRSRRCTLPR